MVQLDRLSTGHDRRESTRLSMQRVDDNDYDLEAMGISDGFRPSNVAVSHNRTLSQTSQRHDHSHGRRTPPPRPSSTTKPRYDSFALRHDGAMGPLPSRAPTTASSSAMPVTRSSSVSTGMAFVRPESPYQGPVGPSHPYQMYPQESRLARTASMATTSTVQVSERSYSGPNGPTHPYGMYPQNTVPEAEDPNGRPAVPPVPVGFPGRSDNYQRRLGPDGEEIADIIGPDGHTEQLPPYTQYPDEGFARKTRPTVQVPVAGAGGIGLATRNPEFASRENLNSPQSSQDSRSIMSDSSHQINTAAMGMSEKPEKKWRIIARKKVWGIIPIWAFVLFGIAVVLFAIILGTVLAVLKPPKDHPPKYHPDNNDDGYVESVVTTMTTTFDATPFTALPSGIPELPTGTYQLPVTTPSVAPASCLVNSAQSGAWSCSIPPALPYQLSIKSIPGSDDVSDNEITMDYGNHTVDFLPYGAQPPMLNGPARLILVNDSKYPERGPAWFFQMPYNKIVILREDQMAVSNAKRDGSGGHDGDAPGFMGRKGVAQAGDKPWFCYWNRTLLEAFIYVNQTSNAGNLKPGASPSASTSPSASATSTIASSVPTSGFESNDYPSSGPTADPQFLPCYPKVLKLEERRVPIGDQTITPYCVKNVVNADGTYAPFLGDDGLPVTVYLNETVPTTVVPRGEKRKQYRSFEERGNIIERQSDAMCGCVWLEQ